MAHLELTEPHWLDERLARLPALWLEGRVKENAEGCWRWNGAAQGGKLMACITSGCANRLTLDARRLVWRLVHGAFPAAGQSPRCPDCADCVHPEHLELRERKSLAANRTAFCAAVARGKRGKSAVMTAELAKEIRESNESQRAKARKYGLSQSFVGAIERGQSWAEPGSVFAGMGEGWRG
jgi:hypothetical protein